MLAGVAALMTFAADSDKDAAPIFVKEIPPGYRDWKVVSVAHEAGDLNDIRAILGNDLAIKAYRVDQISRLCLRPLLTLMAITTGARMNKVTYETEITALLVIDPYNDFISEGGKLWNRIKTVAEGHGGKSHVL